MVDTDTTSRGPGPGFDHVRRANILRSPARHGLRRTDSRSAVGVMAVLGTLTTSGLAGALRTEVPLAFGPAARLSLARQGCVSATAACPAGRAGRIPRMSLADPKTPEPMAPDLRLLESTTPPLPHRTITSAGYRADDAKRTWPSFQYAAAAERRLVVLDFMQEIFERSVAEQQVLGSLPQNQSPVLLTVRVAACTSVRDWLH